MVDNIVTKPVGLVLMVTAHMVFNGPGHAEVTGILGNNVMLQFRFNVSVTNDSHIAVYKTGELKIAETSRSKGCFTVYPENSTVFYHITNLNPNHTQVYWATLFEGMGHLEISNKVQLTVRAENGSTTGVPPKPTNLTVIQDGGSPDSFSLHLVSVLAVVPVVLCAALLPVVICCHMKAKDTQQRQQTQHSSDATVQESVEASSNVPASSLVYSVLDFPKRPPAAVEIDPSGTEYASVSYLPQKRHM